MSKELLDLMNVGATGSICTVAFKNDCPAGWSVTVLEVGCTFRFFDGTTQVVGPVRVSLHSGDSYPLMSTDPKKCVTSVFVALKAKAESEPNPKIITADFKGAPNTCMVYQPAVLGPKQSITQEDHAKGGTAGFLLQVS